MPSKYEYTGTKQPRCPVCNKRFDVGPPVLYFVGENKIAEHRWCEDCFRIAHSLMAMSHKERHIERVVLPNLTRLAHQALGSPNIPDDHVVKGFQFSVIPAQGLTLIMELRHE